MTFMPRTVAIEAWLVPIWPAASLANPTSHALSVYMTANDGFAGADSVGVNAEVGWG